MTSATQLTESNDRLGGQASPRHHASMSVLKVVTLVLAHVLFAHWIVRALTADWNAGGLLLGALAGIALCDLVTLLVHWTIDNYFTSNSPVVGTVVYYFREHHVDPNAMFGRGYVDNNFEQTVLALPFMLAFVPFEFGATASMLVGVGGIMGCYISQIHKWAHESEPPLHARWLQRTHLIVDRRHHDVHHRDYRRNYGLCAGWLDGVFARLRLLEAAETIIYVATGHTPANRGTNLAETQNTTLLDRLGRLGWRSWYQGLAWYAQRTGADFSCMNWGYEDGDIDVPEAHQSERYPKQLYARLVRDVPLEGRRLVEISSGRGGGLAFLTEVHSPASAVGVDFVRGNTLASERAFGSELGSRGRLAYRTADATATGLESGSADVVINVEASHCYPSFSAFLDEAARLLEPGGTLAITDFRPVEEMAEVRDAIRRAGFECLEDVDITEQVLTAMRLDADRRAGLVTQHSAKPLHGVLLNFAGADESADTYRRMAEGRYLYFLMRLRRGTHA